MIGANESPAGKDRLLTRKLRCGKCGAIPDAVHERMAGSDCYVIERDTQGRLILVDMGGDGEHGGQVWAVCLCGHSWTLRGVRHIEQLGPRLDGGT